jgi:lysophospholipase L1-like esterase
MLMIGLIAEACLRSFGSLNIHYYTGYHSKGLHRYPYGDVPINSDGYPDEEFVPTDGKYHIGYVGDSVTYGVGAGFGYRVPDLLQEKFGSEDHWVFAGVGDNLESKVLVRQTRQFRLNTVIYMMNLNDILPEEVASNRSTSWVGWAVKSPLRILDERLRGDSFLYTYSRLGVKNALQRAGYGVTGYSSFELFPSKSQGVIEGTVTRVTNALHDAGRQGLRASCVVILPYEMQVSSDAAQTYKKLGFQWEDSFESGSTQKALMKAFTRAGVNAFDALEAFKDEKNPKVGENFVYHKGDKMDWNHPNRKGHAIIARWLASNPDFVSACLTPRLPEAW